MKVCEIFRSLQGEGTLIGTPTTFIRLTGCNLDCNWCDTAYARNEGKEMTVEQILMEVDELETHFVCVTGGEPLMQKGINELLEELLDDGYHVSLETNGSYSLEDLPCSMDLLVSMDVKCPSSGMEDRMVLENLELLSPVDQLKFIVADRSDMMYAFELLEKNPVQCNIIFTPVGGMDLKPVADFVLKKKLNARVLPQLHKIIWGDERKR
ncbi:MAG: molybdenum cofactor biosynthesis protein A [Methanomassiliicoccales archaeon PtaU1.Bin124]|nr:MAG: molybdenum cofactor biosynthesis protein A [Methanomassiliicoccales archaeon PtaU1.Bin124]